MKSHTLILSTSKIAIPASIDIKFIVNLIEYSITKIDYFGAELDNQADYIDDEMKLIDDSITNVEINFETDEEIHYDLLTKPDIQSIIIGELNNATNPDIRSTDKDIVINL